MNPTSAVSLRSASTTPSPSSSRPVALVRLRQRVKKNRIDEYYARVLRIRAETLQHAGGRDWDAAIERIRDVDSEAFDELIDERLLADDSFRIFLTLSSETLHEFERRRTSE